VKTRVLIGGALITILSGAVALAGEDSSQRSDAIGARMPIDIAQVPEPVSLALFGSGLVMVARRMQKPA
jgi:hypothetical protein